MKIKCFFSWIFSIGLIFLSACGAVKEPLGENVTSDVSKSISTTYHTSGTQGSKENGSSTSATTITGSTSAATIPVAPTAQIVSPLRIKWEDIDSKTKKIMTDCGITKEDLVIDKTKLTYDEEKSSTDICSAYSTYTRGDIVYNFNDLQGKVTTIDWHHSDYEASGTKSEAEIKEIAAAIANTMIDVEQYAYYNYLFDEYFKQHTVIYDRMVGGYRTLEGVAMIFEADGRIRHIGIAKIGLFDGVTIPKVDEKAIDAKCEEILKSRHSNYKSFTARSRKLDIKDGQLLRYYEKQPEIKDGQLVMIVDCLMSYTDKPFTYPFFILVPLDS